MAEWTFKSQAKMWYQIYYQSILQKCQHRSQIFWASFFLVSVPKFQTSIPAWNYFVCRFTTRFVITSARSVLKHLLQLLTSGNTWPLMAWEKSSLATFAQKRKVFYFTHLFFPCWTLKFKVFSYFQFPQPGLRYFPSEKAHPTVHPFLFNMQQGILQI